MTEKNKKQNVTTRSIDEVEFMIIAQGIYEALWLRKLLNELHIVVKSPDKLNCYNKATINISLDPV